MEQPTAEVMDWLALAPSLGPAMVVEVRLPATGRYLLCHVLGKSRLSQVPSNRLLGPRRALTASGIDALVRAGWLPPSRQTMHWAWTADPDVAVEHTARLLVATAQTVLAQTDQVMEVTIRQCGESACAAHAFARKGPAGRPQTGPTAAISRRAR